MALIFWCNLQYVYSNEEDNGFVVTDPFPHKLYIDGNPGEEFSIQVQILKIPNSDGGYVNYYPEEKQMAWLESNMKGRWHFGMSSSRYLFEFKYKDDALKFKMVFG